MNNKHKQLAIHFLLTALSIITCSAFSQAYESDNATDPANGIWIDNVHNIASYIKQKRKN